MIRARRSPDSSLELLLDTMCNTFGGVLFVAILICVLLRMTSRLNTTSKSEAPSRSDLLVLQKDHEQALTKLDELMVAARQQNVLIGTFATPETSAAIEDLRSLREAREAALAERVRLAGRIAKRQEKRDNREVNRKQFAAQLEEALAHATAAERVLAAEIASRTQVARLPRIHRSSKREVPLALAHGRLCFVFNYDAIGSSLGLNTDDIAVTTGLFSKQATPKANRGLVIDTQPSSRERLSRDFGRFNRDSTYFAIAVWEDSFAEFQHVKSVAVKLGFDYRLIPLEQGEILSLGGGAGGDVQ